MYKKMFKTLKRPFALALMVFFLLCSSIPAFAYDDEDFSDVPSKHWAYEAIRNMVRLGVISGYPDGTFRPDKIVSREEFAKMLCGATSIPLANPRSNTFADITKSNWSFRYVETVKDYLVGYPARNGGKPLFLGKQDATREDVAVALVKIKGFDKTTLPNPNILDDMFKDVESVSSNLRDLVAIAVEKKLIQGLPDHTIRGTQALTRAEAAALIDRANKIAGDIKGGTSYDSGDDDTSADLLTIQVDCSKSVGYIGDKLQASAKGIYSNGASRDVTNEVEWTTSDSNIAVINEDGDITLKKAGTVEICAAIDDIEDDMDITVLSQGTNDSEEIQLVKISPETKEITVGNTLNMKAEVVYENGKVVNVTNDAKWESSNSNAAIVSSQGKVVALKEGLTLIKATYKSETGYAAITVNPVITTPTPTPTPTPTTTPESTSTPEPSVTPQPTQAPTFISISISHPYKELKKGSKFTIKAFANYSDRSKKDITQQVTWTIENISIITISQNGEITAQCEGVTKITATFEGKSRHMYVRVKK